MNLLLDTHIALWAILDDARLPKAARALIEAPKSEVFISVASFWEIAIKHALHREAMPLSAKEAHGYFLSAGYFFLPIEVAHVECVEALPNHHRDPFDRILIAQAITEPMKLITHDKVVARYSDTIVVV